MMRIIGHRGASGEAPENTLGSLRLAFEQGADGVEIDVFYSRDRKVVAIHDDETKRLGGVDRRVDEQSLEELKRLDVGAWKGERWRGERIPTLGEVMGVVPAGKELLIELKTGPEIVEMLAGELGKLKFDESKAVLIGFQLAAMAEAKRVLSGFRNLLVASLEEEYEVDFDEAGVLIGESGAGGMRRGRCTVEGLIGAAQRYGLDGVDLQAGGSVNRESVGRFHEAGLEVYVWTVNEGEEGRRMRAVGVDGLTTDWPGKMREAMRGK